MILSPDTRALCCTASPDSNGEKPSLDRSAALRSTLRSTKLPAERTKRSLMRRPAQSSRAWPTFASPEDPWMERCTRMPVSPRFPACQSLSVFVSSKLLDDFQNRRLLTKGSPAFDHRYRAATPAQARAGRTFGPRLNWFKVEPTGNYGFHSQTNGFS